MARYAGREGDAFDGEKVDLGDGARFSAFNNVTPDVVDAAVEEYLSEASDTGPDVKARMIDMLKSHSESSVAKSYYYAQASSSVVNNRPLSMRPNLRLPYMLTDAEVKLLSNYAPEYTMRYELRDSHDHALAAAGRLIDRQLVYSRVPKGVYFSDVGGSVVPLLVSGRLGDDVHTCSPVLDAKDPARRTMNVLRARRLEQDVTSSVAVKEACRKYLEADPSAICDKHVQCCDVKSQVITSIHVYDVPIQDWAKIMVNKSATVVEGCLIFPRDIHVVDFGVCEYVGARYEVNALDDTFKMFFKDSPAIVYQHRLSDYLKYGVDQMLYHENRAFSYKIVERRGDTVFFRILETAKTITPTIRPVMRMPDMAMVCVRGFSVDDNTVVEFKRSRGNLTSFMTNSGSQVYRFPAKLWEEMMSHCKILIEKNTMTYERLINYYRAVAPRQSINGVVISGNYPSMTAEQILPLILHVALFSFVAFARTKAEIKEFVRRETERRSRLDESTLIKIINGFWATVQLPIKIGFLPFSLLSDIIDNALTDKYMSSLLDWFEEPKYVNVSMARLLPVDGAVGTDLTDEVFWIQKAVETGPITQLLATAAEPEIAADVLDVFHEYLPEAAVNVLKRSVEKNLGSDGKLMKEETGGESLADTKNNVSNAVERTSSLVSEAEVRRRKESILEAIVECEAEQSNVESSCMNHYRKLTKACQPFDPALRDYAEAYKNPTFWFIENGYVDRSYANLPLASFCHAALFVPHSAEDESKIVRVVEEVYEGPSCGRQVKRVHFKLDLSYPFTGWAYANDDLNIYNGPAIVSSLRDALDKPLDFQVVLQQGPPGCGKTTSIVEMARPDDIVLVPVKMSCMETKQRIMNRGGEYEMMAGNRVKTVDSYLVNMTDKRVRDLKSTRLLADEAFMIREGRWLAAAAHLGVTTVYAFGDEYQIPHVPRAVCPSKHVKLKYQKANVSNITFRCPASSVACWNHMYKNTIRTRSDVDGTVEMHGSSVGLEIPDQCVMMGMYQSDKKKLEELYGGKNVKIMTVHESQGNTYKHVWLHRFDYRKRTDNFSLYDKPDYVLVAMSRNTHSFKYIAPELDDCVSRCIRKGKNPRAVDLARDVDSAGVESSFE